MISQLPTQLQTVPRNYFEKQQLPGPPRPYSAEETGRELANWETAVDLWQKEDNGPKDLDPREGVFDVGYYEAQFSKSGDEFLFKTTLGEEQSSIHTYGRFDQDNLSLYSGILYSTGETGTEWIIHGNAAEGGIVAGTRGFNETP